MKGGIVIDNHVHCPEKWASQIETKEVEKGKLNPVRTVEDLYALTREVGIDKVCLFAPFNG